MPPDPRLRPLYIGSEIYRRSSYGPKHPLAIPRVSTCTDLCRAMGWLPDVLFVASPMASRAEVARFHDPDYIAALRRAEIAQHVSDADRARFRIGAAGNPVYPEIYRRPMISAGGMMLAARLIAAGGIVHCPGGGTHHGRPDRASGFCYLNDPVLALLTWLDLGIERIAYLDIDAHHGDGVQDAFHDEPRVLTLSVHEAGRWPHLRSRRGPRGRSGAQFPGPGRRQQHRAALLLHEAMLPLIAARRPQAVLLQCGADALDEIRSRGCRCRTTRTGAWWRRCASWRRGWSSPAAAATTRFGRTLLGRDLGERLTGCAIPERATPAAEAVLRTLTYNRAAGRSPPEHWFTTLRDAPREGPVRDEMRRLARSHCRKGSPHETSQACSRPRLGALRRRRGAAARRPSRPARSRAGEAAAGDRDPRRQAHEFDVELARRRSSR